MQSTDIISNVASDISAYSQTNFSIKTDAAMFTVFRKSIYSDTVLAPIRELSTNAIDACVQSNLPINFDVHIPTLSNTNFSVRDYGSGIPLSFLNGDFCIVGASTKRNDNMTTGSFGMGRLSPLAYTTSCTVESFIDGLHHSYLLTVQEGIPVLIHLSSNPTSEPTGARFSFPVEPADIEKFYRSAANLFKYFDHKPNTNEKLPEVSVTLNHDNFMLTDDNLGIVMGNIYYKLDWNHVNSRYSNLVLKVPIGKVSLTPGRESLNYDEATVAYLQEYLIEAEEELIAISNTHIASQPTDYLRLKAYSDIYDKTPYGVRGNILVPISNIFNVHPDYNHPLIATSLIMVCKIPNYKTLRKPDDIRARLQWFLNADYFIADQRSFSEALSTVNNSHVVVFKPADMSAKNIKASTEDLIAALDAFGLPSYTLASECEVTPKDNALKVKRPTTVNIREVRNGIGSPEPYTESDNNLYYVLLDGNYTSLKIQPITLYSLFKDHFPTLNIYAIAASHLPKIKKDPKFINFLDYLKETYDESNPLTIEQTENKTFSTFSKYWGSTVNKLLQISTAPSYLALALNNYTYLQALPHRDLSPTDIEAIQSIVSTTFKTLTPVVTLENLQKRYSILENANSVSKDTLERYFMLENHYAYSACPPK